MKTHTTGELLALLQEIDPIEFEHLIADIWEAQGWETTVRSGSGDRGVDVEARRSDPFDRTQFIQVKRYSDENTIGSDLIRTYATLYQQAENIDSVVLVTSSSLTGPAEILAQDLDVRVLTGSDLCQLILDHDLVDLVEEYADISNSNAITDSNTSKQDGPTPIIRSDGVSSTFESDKVQIGTPRFRARFERILDPTEQSDFHEGVLVSSMPLMPGTREDETERPPAISLFDDSDGIKKLLTATMKGIGIGSENRTESPAVDALTIYAFLEDEIKCLNGKDDHWDQLIIPYEAITEVEYFINRKANRLVIHTTDQTYHLWITGTKAVSYDGYDRTDLEKAIMQIDSTGKIVSNSEIQIVDSRQSKYGSRKGHLLFGILTVWWTFGVGNLLYALFRRYRYNPELAQQYHRPPLWESTDSNNE